MREALRRKLEREAEKKKISANAEALDRIERTFEQEEREEAQYQDLQESQEVFDEMQRQYYEEQARERATINAALRSAEVLNVLVGGDENAQLLRLMILGLGNNPGWAATPESRKALADKVHHFLVSVDLQKGDTQ
jgi:hypothetical protein